MIDHYSRYLRACHLTASYSATDVATGLDLARAEAERVSGPLAKPPFLVTDNGSCFLAHRFRDHLAQAGYSHVRIRYRTGRRGEDASGVVLAGGGLVLSFAARRFIRLFAGAGAVTSQGAQCRERRLSDNTVPTINFAF